MIFMIQAAWAQHQATEDRHQILTTLDQQSRQIACLADTTQAYEAAVADLLLTERTYPDRTADFVAGRLDQLRGQLADARQACLTVSPPGLARATSSTRTTRVPTTNATTSTFR